MNRSFATELDQVLYEQGRKNVWLARELEVTPSTVTRWRRGEFPPTEDKQLRINALLGRSIFFSRPCRVFTNHHPVGKAA